MKRRRCLKWQKWCLDFWAVAVAIAKIPLPRVDGISSRNKSRVGEGNGSVLARGETIANFAVIPLTKIETVSKWATIFDVYNLYFENCKCSSKLVVEPDDQMKELKIESFFI